MTAKARGHLVGAAYRAEAQALWGAGTQRQIAVGAGCRRESHRRHITLALELAQANAGITAKTCGTHMVKCRREFSPAQTGFIQRHIKIKVHGRVKPDLRRSVGRELAFARGAGLAVDGVVGLGTLYRRCRFGGDLRIGLRTALPLFKRLKQSRHRQPFFLLECFAISCVRCGGFLPYVRRHVGQWDMASRQRIRHHSKRLAVGVALQQFVQARIA